MLIEFLGFAGFWGLLFSLPVNTEQQFFFSTLCSLIYQINIYSISFFEKVYLA
jgi:hypothetical protein